MKNWNKKTVEKYIAYYYTLLKSSKDLKTRTKIEQTINSLEELKEIISFHPFDIFIRDSFKSFKEDDYAYLKRFKNYIPIFQTFNQEDEFESIFNEKTTRLKLTNKEIFNITKEFYHNTNQVFSHYFDKVNQNKKTYFNISKKSIFELFYQILGFTACITNTDITFINVVPTNNVSVLISSIHEYAHAISYSMNTDHINDINKTNFCETESLFMELLAYDFISKYLNLPLDIHKEQIKDYNNVLFYNRIICGKIAVYKQLSSKNINSKNEIKKYLLNNTNLLNKDISQVLYTLIETNAPYVISYLTAIELYLISKNDKSLSLELLKDIIELKNSNSTNYLKDIKKIGITPTKNIKKYLELITDKEEKLNDNKRILHRY